MVIESEAMAKSYRNLLLLVNIIIKKNVFKYFLYLCKYLLQVNRVNSISAATKSVNNLYKRNLIGVDKQ